MARIVPRPSLIPLLFVAIAQIGVVGAPVLRAQTTVPASPSDFNGDGVTDLAIGVSDGQGGAVSVVYGTPNGLSASGTELWSLGNPGVIGDPIPVDRFGTALTSGDFDADGYADLAVGIPGKDVLNTGGAGAVLVLHGSSTGLTAEGNQLWTAASEGVKGSPGTDAAFGGSLAAGNFGNGPAWDLAIGVPGRRGWSPPEPGAVSILYGTANGLDSAGNRRLVGHHPSPENHFGFSLAAANFGKGPQADLAIGVPGNVSEGHVFVVYGTNTGVTTTGSQLFFPDQMDMPPFAGENPTSLGDALAAADLGRSGEADLAIGGPGYDFIPPGGCDDGACHYDVGAVGILYGSANGLTLSGFQRWSLDSPGVAGEPWQGDRLGASLAAGNFGNGPTGDLAIGGGAPLDDGGGKVHVLYGKPSGLAAAGSQEWSQDTPGIPDQQEERDGFGMALRSADFGKGPQADLAIGAPWEDFAAVEDGGAVHVVYGSNVGLTATGNQFWTQDSAGLPDVPEPFERFGSALG